jgi:DNA-binding PucR family transcriptional regulator
VRAAARELGISRSDALRAVRRVDRIAPAVREALRDIPEIADNGVDLDALADLPAEQQAAAVAAVQNGDAPSVRAAIATSAQPTGHEAANADNPLDAILEQIRRLGENKRESLWEALAGQWHEEISRALACRLLKTDELRRPETPSAGATPSHPDVRGGPVQAINGPFCEQVYAIGSLQWAEQQRRQQNGV